jgi:hypothetical protein
MKLPMRAQDTQIGRVCFAARMKSNCTEYTLREDKWLSICLEVLLTARRRMYHSYPAGVAAQHCLLTG